MCGLVLWFILNNTVTGDQLVFFDDVSDRSDDNDWNEDFEVLSDSETDEYPDARVVIMQNQSNESTDVSLIT